jgi:hypothetical protein
MGGGGVTKVRCALGEPWWRGCSVACIALQHTLAKRPASRRLSRDGSAGTNCVSGPVVQGLRLGLELIGRGAGQAKRAAQHAASWVWKATKTISEKVGAGVARGAKAFKKKLAKSTEEILREELGRKPTKKEVANYENRLRQEAGDTKGPARTEKDFSDRGGHETGARGSTSGRHEKGQGRLSKDKGNEKGDTRREY